MKINPFHKRAIGFIWGVVKQRIYLLHNHISQKNEAVMNQAIGELTRYLDAYTYDNDLQTARFWLNNAINIEVLLPGKQSPTFESLNMRFNDLYEEARAIVQTPILK